jgi:uncharacterized Zn finger protein
MFTISETDSKTLAEALQNLSQKDIKDCCSRTIYNRGEEYYDEDVVSSLRYSHAFKATVRVSGTSNYTISLKLSNGEILADCTCPYTAEYGDVCKHIVAALLFATNNTVEYNTVEYTYQTDNIPQSLDERTLFRHHIESLSQTELVELIERFASPEFRSEIIGRMASRSTAEKMLHELHLRILKVIKSLNKRNSEYCIETIVKLLNEARGYWSHSPEQITSIITGIIRSFDAMQGEDEDDYDDDYYEQEDTENVEAFAEVVADFILALDTADKFKAINSIRRVALDTSYRTFDDFPAKLDELYTNKDIPKLQSYTR